MSLCNIGDFERQLLHKVQLVAQLPALSLPHWEILRLRLGFGVGIRVVLLIGKSRAKVLRTELGSRYRR